MMDDNRLRELLTAAAESYPVPEHGPDAVGRAVAEAPEAPEAPPARPPGHRLLKITSAAAAAVLVAGGLVAVLRSGGQRTRSQGAAVGVAPTAPPSPASTAPGGAAGPGAPPAGVPAPPGSGSASHAATPPLQTANLDLRVPRDRFSAVLTQLGELAGRRGGSVAAQQSSDEDGPFPRATVVLVFGPGGFPGALDEARSLGQTLTSDNEATTVDVRRAQIDARLGQLRAQRDDLARRTAPPSSLARVQAEIDRLEAELAQLGRPVPPAALLVVSLSVG